MKKSTVMIAMMMVLIFAMETTYAQCCGTKPGKKKKAVSMPGLFNAS